MEKNIPRRLLIVAFFVFPAPPCAVKSSVVVQISDPKTWHNAREYCKNAHSELATIRDRSEANMLDSFEGWIGLQWTDHDQWKWSVGDQLTNFTFWGLGRASNNECVFKPSSQQLWMVYRCDQTHPFLCMDETMILVQEKKTWEEALLHCRELSWDRNTYDFASLPEIQAIVLGSREIMEATDEVWIGLRFLASEWFWVNGQEVTSSLLPGCPDQEKCAALNQKDGHWKILDCNEKRPFLCDFK